jgi:NADPH:quinone reductase-like Zn-dependent oxidoreductase
MRALQFSRYGPPDVMHVAEVPEPHAGPGQIRVAVRVSGLSTGEATLRSGKVRDAIPLPLPHRTGFDAAGVVDEVGAGVTGTGTGDEVFGYAPLTDRGANADHAVLDGWAPKPAAWTWEEAGGAAGSAETSVRVLDRLGVGPGRTVLVHGAAGAVGTVAVQLAVARGAEVIGTASEHNHDLLRALGARPATYGPGLVDRVRALGEVDAVFDCAGAQLPDLIAIAGGTARVVTIADLGAAAHGVHLSHSVPAGSFGNGDPLAAHSLAIAHDLAGRGLLRIPVAAAFPLGEAAAAHELSESRHAVGRIVFVHSGVSPT